MHQDEVGGILEGTLLGWSLPMSTPSFWASTFARLSESQQENWLEDWMNQTTEPPRHFIEEALTCRQAFEELSQVNSEVILDELDFDVTLSGDGADDTQAKVEIDRRSYKQANTQLRDAMRPALDLMGQKITEAFSAYTEAFSTALVADQQWREAGGDSVVSWKAWADDFDRLPPSDLQDMAASVMRWALPAETGQWRARFEAHLKPEARFEFWWNAWIKHPTEHWAPAFLAPTKAEVTPTQRQTLEGWVLKEASDLRPGAPSEAWHMVHRAVRDTLSPQTAPWGEWLRLLNDRIGDSQAKSQDTLRAMLQSTVQTLDWTAWAWMTAEAFASTPPQGLGTETYRGDRWRKAFRDLATELREKAPPMTWGALARCVEDAGQHGFGEELRALARAWTSPELAAEAAPTTPRKRM